MPMRSQSTHAGVESVEMSDEVIVRTIPRFQWFAHVDFGNEIVARSTAWPDAAMGLPAHGIVEIPLHRTAQPAESPG